LNFGAFSFSGAKVRWVLSWGGKAKVLGPPELKRLVRDEVRQIEVENASEVQASN